MLRLDGRPLRAAVVGCGRIGAGFSAPDTRSVLTHAAAYAASSRTELVAVCDADASAAAGCGRTWGVAGFADLDAMLVTAQPEVVSICTPDDTHAELTQRVLGAASVRGMLVEKPLALTIADAETTVRLAEQRGVVLGVNYSRRWATGIRFVADQLRSGRFGPVQTVTGHYANGWIHNGTHWIDLARLLVGDVLRVRTVRRRPTSDPHDPSLEVELAFVGGAEGVVHGHPGTGLSFFEMDLICERGRVRLSQGAEQIELYELGPSPTFAGFVQHLPVGSSLGGLGQSMRLAVDDVARCVEKGGAPACTGMDGIAALRVAQAGRDANDRWVTVGQGA